MPTACVTQARLTAFLTGQLSPEEDQAVTEHVDACPRCEALTAELSDDVEARELAAAAEGRQSVSAVNEPQVEDLCRRLHALGLYEMADDSAGALADDAAGTDDAESTHDTHSFIGVKATQTAVVDQREGNRAPAQPTTPEADSLAEPPAAAETLRFKRLGRYEILRTLGAGTFGIVYLAQDTKLNRQVALKIARPTVLADDSLRLRFVREAATLAKLQHPNIVPVFEADEVEGLCYLVIAYCDGPTLEQWLQEQSSPLDPRLAVKLLLPLVDAVEHAHAHGVLHRDIKPANVILERTEADACELDFVPRLTDFGLAKVVEEKSNATLSGIVLGTAQYMAPEQAAGHVERIGPETDVYALGAVLYQMLTGRPPIEGNTTIDTLRRLLIDDPEEVRRLVPGVPADLDAIVLRCLNKAVTDRYRTAAELAADLRRFLAGQPTIARPLTMRQRAGRWLQRNPTRAGLLALTVVVAMLTGGLYYYAHALWDSQSRIERGWVEAQRQEERLRAEVLKNRQSDYVRRIESAVRAADDGDVPHAFAELEGTPQDLRGTAYYYLLALCTQAPLEEANAGMEIYQIRLSPDRRELAAVGKDGIVRLYDARTLRPLRAVPLAQEEINGIAYSHNGRLLAAGLDDGTVRVFDPSQQKNPRPFDNHPSRVYGVAFYDRSSKLAICGEDPLVRLRDAVSGELLDELTGHTAAVEALAISPDGRLLATASSDNTALIWSLEPAAAGQSRKPVRAVTGHTGRLSSICFSPDGRWLATGSFDKSVCLSDVASGRRLKLAEHLDAVQTVAFSDDSRWLYAGDRGGLVRRYRIEPTRAASPDVKLAPESAHDTWRAHRGRVWCLIPGAEPGTMLSCGEDGVVKLWSASPPQPLRRVLDPTPSDEIVDVTFAQDGELLLVLRETSGVEVLDAHSLAPRLQLTSRHHDWTTLVALDDKQEVAAANEHGVVAIWSLETGECRRLISHPREDFAVIGLVYSPQAQLLAVLPYEPDNVRLHHVTRPGFYEQLPTANLASAAFSPDGLTLAVDSLDNILVYDLKTRTLQHTLKGHGNTVNGLAYSPDGKQLVSASADRSLRLWTRQGRLIGQINSHRHGLADAQFTPDGKTLVSIDDAGTLRLTHVATLTKLLDIPTDTRRLRKLALAPDSRRLAVLREDHSILLVGVAEEP